MKFSDLKPGHWASYVEEGDAFDGIWAFQHIPKTAGSSITNSLSRYASPYRNISADHASSVPARKQYLALSQSFPLEHNGKPLRSLSGHFLRREMDNLSQRCPSMRIFTFVRDPVSRVISDYRYSRTPAHARWKQQIADFPNLDSYIDKGQDVRNKMTFFLEGTRDGDAEAIVESIVSRISYIGLLEEMDLSYRILSALLRMRASKVKHARPTEATPDNSEKPTEEQIERIRELNRLDQALFDRVRGTHLSIREEVDSWEGGRIA